LDIHLILTATDSVLDRGPYLVASNRFTTGESTKTEGWIPVGTNPKVENYIEKSPLTGMRVVPNQYSKTTIWPFRNMNCHQPKRGFWLMGVPVYP